MNAPRVRFLSLFVDDPATSADRLEALLGCAPREDARAEGAPSPHPFAAEGPIVFELGEVELALYRASAAKGTHAGDVGIGVALNAAETGLADETSSTKSANSADDAARAVAEHDTVLNARLAASKARALAPSTTLADGRPMRVAMTLDRHFFELIGAR